MAEAPSSPHIPDNLITEEANRERTPPIAPMQPVWSPASYSSDIVFDTASGGQAYFAYRDIVDGLSHVKLWSMLGWLNVRQRYRRSTLGPFWLTISMAITILGLGLVYSEIFHTTLAGYLPFVSLGLITWELISKSVIEGCQAFLLLEGLIKQIRLPLTTHVASLVWRNVIIFAHNIVVYVVIALIFQINPGLAVLWVFPGFLLVIGNLIWITLAIATISTRFRDIPVIVVSLVQVLFLVTPIFWLPRANSSRAAIVHGNIFYHLVELIRSPLLGHAPSAESWILTMAFLVVGWSGTFFFFKKFRRRIAYWL